jgi:hypothetical protein
MLRQKCTMILWHSKHEGVGGSRKCKLADVIRLNPRLYDALNDQSAGEFG